MKKFLLTALVLISLSATAQKKLGLQIAYGSGVKTFAAGANAEFFVSDKVSIAPNFTYYFPKKEEITFFTITTTNKYAYWELNGDVHYYFMDNDESMALYGIGGLSILGSAVNVTIETTDFNGDVTSVSTKTNTTDVGLNLGVGANFGTGNTRPFGEIKYETVGSGQLVIMAGVRFSLGN